MEDIKQEPIEEKQKVKSEDKKAEIKKEVVEEKPEEEKETKEEKVGQKKVEKKAEKQKVKSIVRKSEAVVKGKDLQISTKHSIAICDFIRGKTIDKAITSLTEVIEMKKAVPMKGELPHRKGEGMERGRYPIKACQEFIKLLRQLAANATINGIDIEKTRISCKADKASRPYKRFGNMRFKRTHITLKLKTEEKKIKINKKN